MTEEKLQEPSEINSIDHSSSETILKPQDVFKTNLPENEILQEVNSIIIDNDLEDYRNLITRGALLANNPNLIDNGDYTQDEQKSIKRETTHPIWSLSFHMILAALTTSFAAVNFGMDESAVGGAQLQYNVQFGIKDVNLQGFVVAAPYLAAAIIGCPLTVVLNNKYGRKWIILLSCFIGFSGSLWQAFANGTAALLIGRLYLGIGMGLNSATVPIYTAECSPAVSRGAILMLWQTFIAFGVCLGSVFNRAFVEINGSLSWRLMIGSSCVAPVICGALVLLPPESPRWLISQNRVKDSFESIIKLRSSKISGSKDFYILFESLKFENQLKIDDTTLFKQFVDLFKYKRNRFALWVSFLGIFGQQYGGVNILVNYTPTILTSAGVDSITAIAGSIGIGGGCFLATFLSTQLIDRFGRRKMLIYTLPVEGLCLFWLGGILNIENNNIRLGLGLTAMYVFVFFYGWGIGPVSFTLVAETPALPVRAAHSALLMGVNWLLCFCLSMTWPKMSSTMTTSGGLYFYGAWNFILAILVFFYLPETKRFTLEELDEIFKIGATNFATRKLHGLFHKN
ncbi:putative membrane protein [Wickerhamomyces ciferrii]|uniref:Membrane protein n=1 Tax=Wickerhamomyces ciferrii (strain ATCC 14091 / BCRC 22168 / CBS 111 / JCM 3599 / NBRC 0793 / NRRL Y-1031 F-60-10) TaxID=1206466 RepID=K0KQA0_WICCF|nr:uncharacterized protein BN7_3894 [Wickerhamomyces ciferrii]CCH44332.1 putative membrane protein [Wickerhamomyces ciferrii]